MSNKLDEVVKKLNLDNEGYNKDVIFCIECGNSNKRHLFKANFGFRKYHMYCFTCVKKIYDIFIAESLKISDDYNLAGKKAGYKICMLMNIPFIENLFLEMQESNRMDTLIIDYVKKVTNDKQLSNMTFFDGRIVLDEDIAANNEYHITPEMYSFWGAQNNPEDIVFLENELSNWKLYVPCDTYVEKITLRDICMLTLTIRKKQLSGEKFKEEMDMRNTLIKLNGYDPAQQKKNEGSEFKETFGVFIERIEKEEPIKVDGELFKDVDKLSGLMEKYLGRSMRNFLTGSRIFPEMEYENE